MLNYHYYAACSVCDIGLRPVHTRKCLSKDHVCKIGGTTVEAWWRRGYCATSCCQDCTSFHSLKSFLSDRGAKATAASSTLVLQLSVSSKVSTVKTACYWSTVQTHTSKFTRICLDTKDLCRFTLPPRANPLIPLKWTDLTAKVHGFSVFFCSVWALFTGLKGLGGKIVIISYFWAPIRI